MVVEEEDFQEYEQVTEKEIKIDFDPEKMKTIGKKRIFQGIDAWPGDGQLLGLKIALQTLDCILVTGGSIKQFVTNTSSIYGGDNPVATAVGISRVIKDKPILCYACDTVTSQTFHSIISAVRRKENIIYVCANNQSSSYGKMTTYAKRLQGYRATASVGYPQDFIEKLEKADKKDGFRFIELLCPSPRNWGFDPSNTVYIAKLASQTKLWHLYEIENGNVKITKRPDYEPVERFFEAQKKFKIDENKLNEIQKKMDIRWKKINDGKLI